MDRIQAALINAQQAYQWWSSTWPTIKTMMIAGHRLHVEIRPEKRSDQQNRLMWSCLGDLARQINWHGQKLDAKAWKDMATAALKRQRVVPGIDGGFVVLGQSTSKMTKTEMTDLIDFVFAFGDERGVQERRRWTAFASSAWRTRHIRSQGRSGTATRSS